MCSERLETLKILKKSQDNRTIYLLIVLGHMQWFNNIIILLYNITVLHMIITIYIVVIVHYTDIQSSVTIYYIYIHCYYHYNIMFRF